MRFFRYLIIVLAVAAFAAPPAANAAPGAFTVVNGGNFGQGFYDAANPGENDHSVSIFTGETVTFTYPAPGDATHNVKFLAVGPQPSACAQTAGPVLGAVPPLPTYTIPAPWAGNCTFNVPGTYTFYCEAHPEMVGDITVTTKVNAPPTVTAGRTPSGDTTTGTPIAFTATGNDTDGDTLTYLWDFGNGDTSTQQNPTYTYTTPGTKTAKVTVSDGKGGTAEATLSIIVAQANRNPAVTGSRTPAGVLAVNQSVAFTATGTDADGDTLTYTWNFGDSTPESTEQNPSHAYTTPGDYTAKVTVSDVRGGTGTANVAVTVTLTGNANPTVTSSRTPTGNTRVGVPISFTAVGTDADGDTLTYSWNFGDGDTSTQQNPTHTYLTANTFNAVVTVNDGRGGTGSATALQIVVQANRAPTISTMTATPAEGMAPLNVTFAATATDADGHALTYEWDLDGDGTFETTGQNPSRTYNAGASPTLRVSDAFGGVVTRTLTNAPNGGGVNVFPATLDPAARYNVLVFSRTAAFRHSAIDEAYNAIKLMGSQQNFTVDWTEDPTRFNDAFLSRYDLVVFNSTTGDVLNDTQQAAFERFIKAGGGYTGIHSATDTEYGWAWYGQLTGAYFRDHPNGTPTATVVVEDPNSPATAGIPARWTRVDEWYNFQGIVNPVVNGGGTDVSPRGNTPIHVLLTMDESTYNENDGNSTDDDHPIAWCKRYDGGRMFYTALGHTEATYTDATFLSHLKGGMEMAAGVIADADCGLRAPTASPARVPAGSVDTGTPVTFTAGGADADGDTLTYAWDFGDGQTSTEANPSHAFATVGQYAVKVTVSDGRFTSTSTIPVTVTAETIDTTGEVAANVDFVLALSITGAATFADFTPGVSRDYTTSVAAQVTSTAGSADLTVVDPSSANAGKLVNGTYVLEQPLQAKASNAANPNTAFAPVTGSPLALLSYPRAISADAVTLGFKQSVGGGETLRAGGYKKTLRFTLSTTTP
jgi:PKD repeat protein/type 1 glutamine amidotransferase